MNKTKKTHAASAALLASVLGFITIVEIIGFGFTACGSGDDDSGGTHTPRGAIYTYGASYHMLVLSIF